MRVCGATLLCLLCLPVFVLCDIRGLLKISGFQQFEFIDEKPNSRVSEHLKELECSPAPEPDVCRGFDTVLLVKADTKVALEPSILFEIPRCTVLCHKRNSLSLSFFEQPVRLWGKTQASSFVTVLVSAMFVAESFLATPREFKEGWVTHCGETNGAHNIWVLKGKFPPKDDPVWADPAVKGKHDAPMLQQLLTAFEVVDTSAPLVSFEGLQVNELCLSAEVNTRATIALKAGNGIWDEGLQALKQTNDGFSLSVTAKNQISPDSTPWSTNAIAVVQGIKMRVIAAETNDAFLVQHPEQAVERKQLAPEDIVFVGAEVEKGEPLTVTWKWVREYVHTMIQQFGLAEGVALRQTMLHLTSLHSIRNPEEAALHLRVQFLEHVVAMQLCMHQVDTTAHRWLTSYPGSLLSGQPKKAFPDAILQLNIPYLRGQPNVALLDISMHNDFEWNLQLLTVTQLKLRASRALPQGDLIISGDAQYQFGEEIVAPGWTASQLPAKERGLKIKGIAPTGKLRIYSDEVPFVRLEWRHGTCMLPKAEFQPTQRFSFLVDNINIICDTQTSISMDGLGIAATPADPETNKDYVAQFGALGRLAFRGATPWMRKLATSLTWSDAAMNRKLWEHYKRHQCWSRHSVLGCIEDIGGFDNYLAQLDAELQQAAKLTQQEVDDFVKEHNEPDFCRFVDNYLPWPEVHSALKKILGWQIEPSAVGWIEGAYLTRVRPLDFVFQDQPSFRNGSSVDCSVAQKMPRQCVPHLAFCLTDRLLLESRNKLQLLRDACQLDEDTASNAAVQMIGKDSSHWPPSVRAVWEGCWKKIWSTSRCVGGEPLIHLDDILNGMDSGIKSARATHVRVHTSKHGPPHQATYQPVAAYVQFEAALEAKGLGMATLAAHVPPYMVADEKVREDAIKSLDAEERLVSKIAQAANGCGEMLKKAAPNAAWSLFEWRASPDVLGTRPVEAPRTLAPFGKEIEDNGAHLQVRKKAREYVGRIELHLRDPLHEFPEVMVVVEHCLLSSCHAWQPVSAGDLLLSPACKTKKIDDHHEAIVCQGSPHVTLTPKTPFVARNIRIALRDPNPPKPMPKSGKRRQQAPPPVRLQVGLMDVEIFAVDMVVAPGAPRFHSVSAVKEQPEGVDKKNAQQLAQLMFALNRGEVSGPELAPNNGEQESDFASRMLGQVGNLHQQLVKQLMVHGTFPGQLHAAAFGHSSCHVVVSVDGAPLYNLALQTYRDTLGCGEPSDAPSCGEKFGFWRYATTVLRAYINGEVAEGGQVAPVPGLYSAACFGVCDQPWKLVAIPFSLRLQSAAANSLERDVSFNSLSLGSMYFGVKHITLELLRPVISGDLMLLFPKDSKPHALGPTIALDHFVARVSEMRQWEKQVFGIPTSTEERILNSPSHIVRLLKDSDNLRLNTIQHLLETRSIVVDTAEHPASVYIPYNIPDRLEGNLDPFFMLRLTLKCDADDLHLDFAESRLLSLPIAGDSEHHVLTDDDIYFEKLQGIEVEIVNTLPPEHVAEAREAEIFMGGGLVHVELAPLHEPGAEEAGPMQRMLFEGKITPVPPAPQSSKTAATTTEPAGPPVPKLEPPATGIIDVIQSLGFGPHLLFMDKHLYLANSGIHDRVERLQRIVRKLLGPKASLREVCEKVLANMFGEENQKSDALELVCTVIDTSKSSDETETLVRHIVKVFRARTYKGSRPELFDTNGAIPDTLKFVVSIGSDGIVQIGLRTEKPLRSLLPAAIQQPNEPKLVSVKLWKLLVGTNLGGSGVVVVSPGKTEAASLVAASPEVEFDLEVEVLPLVNPPSARLQTLLRPIPNPKKQSRSKSSRFDTTFFFRDVVVSSPPQPASNPPIYCLKCTNALGVESVNPFAVGINFVVEKKCEATDQTETSLQVKQGLGIRLPFLQESVLLPPHPPTPDIVQGIQQKFFCDRKTENDVAKSPQFFEALLDILWKSEAATTQTIDLPLIKGNAKLVFANKDTLPALIQQLEQSADLKDVSAHLQAIGVPGVSNLVEIMRKTEFHKYGKCPGAKRMKPYETNRMDERHPNSLSPRATQNTQSKTPGILKAMQSSLGSLLESQETQTSHKANVLSRLKAAAISKLKSKLHLPKPTDEEQPQLPEFEDLAILLLKRSFAREKNFLGLEIEAVGSFLLEDLVETHLRGGFNIFGISDNKKAEFLLDGGLVYKLGDEQRVEVLARGTARLADRMGPLAVRVIDGVLYSEMHLGKEDLRIFTVARALPAVGQGKTDFMVDMRVGSAEVNYMDGAGISRGMSSCWWGPGKRVAVQDLDWLTKHLGDDLRAFPVLLPKSKFDMVQLVGKLSDLADGRGTLNFFNNNSRCFSVSVEDWNMPTTWEGFMVACKLGAPKPTAPNLGEPMESTFKECDDIVKDKNKKSELNKTFGKLLNQVRI